MTLDDIRTGGKVTLARALSDIEAAPDREETAVLLDEAFRQPRGLVLGLTGPPGVGKSTLVDKLIAELRERGETVGVIAVDPSSKRSRGALLGDRTRLTVDPDDSGIFIRSMAARERLGGLAEAVFPASVLMRALFDVVLIETVGVGQSETAISETADLVVFCAQPGSGDALQFMKAGVMEVPDLILVTKSDLEAQARRTFSDLRGALSLIDGERRTDLLACSASRGEGISEVVDWIAERRGRAASSLSELMVRHARVWAKEQIAERFGREGLVRFAEHESRETPFSFTTFFSSTAAYSAQLPIDFSRF